MMAVYGWRMQQPFRIGSGHDVHGLFEGHELVLGGVVVPSPSGFDTHSDGDVLSHALVDALAGSIADGDLGRTFPRKTPRPRMRGASNSSATLPVWLELLATRSLTSIPS